ncbi:NBS resistance protein [Trifolium pratense]|uniref:NBS resistance protein n=1 Tax=Trifolium pratense TaxID=57577 RepID=A0A2K3LRT8_TRIPR|nr:NBS resistance protein [Trifolium pratense]
MSSLVNLSTKLDELKLESCRRLQYLELTQLHVKRIFLWGLPSLEWIVSDNNNGDNSSTFASSLTEINLFYLPNLKGWLSKGCCHQLKKISLSTVTAETLQQAVTHSNVEFLDINDILNFKSLRGVFQHLTRVSELFINKCPEFDPCNDEDGCYSMEWKELTNLKVLAFGEIPKMKYLPEGLQHITTLQTLRIIYCYNLTSIPEWATSLQVLDIQYCPNVTPLPAAVKDQ